MRAFRIGQHTIDDTSGPFVVAEIGNNHGGSVERACQLIQVAKDAGADAVKFQTRTLSEIYTSQLLGSPYDHDHSYGDTYGRHRQAIEFTVDQFAVCQRYATERGLLWFSTAFDEASADRLMSLGVPALKMASGDLTNIPLLRYCAGLGVPIIVSTGWANLDDIDRAVGALKGCQYALLHCTAAYPPEPKDVHLRVIPMLRERYPETVIGWSTHDPGVSLSLVAYALGASIIEKHITLNRAMKGTDQAFSLEPKGLATLVEDLHKVRCALGRPEKDKWPAEVKPMLKMAKSLVGAKDLPAGHVLRPGDLARKSPAGGFPPYLEASVLGFPLARPLLVDEVLTEAHLKSATTA